MVLPILAAVLAILAAVLLALVSVLALVLLPRPLALLRPVPVFPPILAPVATLPLVAVLAPVLVVLAPVLALIVASIAAPVPILASVAVLPLVGLLGPPAILIARALPLDPATIFPALRIGAGRRRSTTLAPLLLPQPEHLVPALPEPAGTAAPQVPEFRRLPAILHVAGPHGTLAPLDDEPRAKRGSTVDR